MRGEAMQVLLHNLARKYYERLNEPTKGDINTAIDGLEKEPSEGDIKPLAGQKGRFRLVAGSHRILFRYEQEHIFITHIEPRGQAYNKKNMRGKR